VNLSLDFDGTYTRDPETWNNVVALFRAAGHKVYVVTMRYDNENEGTAVRSALEGKVDGIYFTGRKAKAPFMFEQGISIDVWLDDIPFFVDNNAGH
jgi:DNA-binding LacI/PurR family transcriptional regulator